MPRRPFEHLRRLAANNEQDRFLGARLRDDAFADDPTIAQDDHTVGNLEHLVEPVRDVNHADAPRAKPPKRDEQPRHFVCRQAGRRLVQHEDLGLRRQRASNGHKRLLGACQVMDPHLRIDIRADDLQRPLGAHARGVPVDNAEAPRKTEHEGDVFRNGHPLDETKILVEECDGQVTQPVGHVPPAVVHCARIERMDSGENLDQRGFAGAILTQERDDLARADFDACVTEGARAAKPLRHAAHRQEMVVQPRGNGHWKVEILPECLLPGTDARLRCDFAGQSIWLTNCRTCVSL